MRSDLHFGKDHIFLNVTVATGEITNTEVKADQI